MIMQGPPLFPSNAFWNKGPLLSCFHGHTSFLLISVCLLNLFPNLLLLTLLDAYVFFIHSIEKKKGEWHYFLLTFSYIVFSDIVEFIFTFLLCFLFTFLFFWFPVFSQIDQDLKIHFLSYCFWNYAPYFYTFNSSP